MRLQFKKDSMSSRKSLVGAGDRREHSTQTTTECCSRMDRRPAVQPANLSVSRINRKMSATEALGFMLAFLVIGVSFGLGFTLVSWPKQSAP